MRSARQGTPPRRFPQFPWNRLVGVSVGVDGLSVPGCGASTKVLPAFGQTKSGELLRSSYILENGRSPMAAHLSSSEARRLPARFHQNEYFSEN